MNRHPKKMGCISSKYPGVTWNKRSQKWNAQAQINGIHKHIGTYSREEDAHDAYLAVVNPIEAKQSEINSTSLLQCRPQEAVKEIENYVHREEE
jgi:acyl-CoA-binding protein